jgi:hypothetical protein
MRLTSIHSRLLIVNLFGAEGPPLYALNLTHAVGWLAACRGIRYFHLSCIYISMPPSPGQPPKGIGCSGTVLGRGCSMATRLSGHFTLFKKQIEHIKQRARCTIEFSTALAVTLPQSTALVSDRLSC